MVRMKTSWSKIKNVIDVFGKREILFLAILDNQGIIQKTNSKMAQAFQLEKFKGEPLPVSHLIHPVHLKDFQYALDVCMEQGITVPVETFLQNGYHETLEWRISPLSDEAGNRKYLCMASRCAGNERLGWVASLDEKYMKLILESFDDGLLIQDISGGLICANHRAAEIFNVQLRTLYDLPNIESLWQGAWEITGIDGSKIDLGNELFLKALHTRTTITRELVLNDTNGTKKCLTITAQPLIDQETQQPFAIVSILKDLTEEKRLVYELKSRKALFKGFMNQSPNLYWVVDADNTLIYCNRTFVQFFGLTETEIIGKPIKDFLPAGFAKFFTKKHGKVIEENRVLKFVEKLEMADGTSTSFHVNLFSIESWDDKRLVCGEAINLSEQHAIERELKEANERLLNITRATSDAIWEWDMRSGNVFRNEALQKLMGYPAAEPMGKGLAWWLQRIHPEDRNRLSDRIMKSSEQREQSWEEQYRFKNGDGEYVQVRDRGYIVYENEMPVRMIGSIQDISGLKELENQLVEEKLRKQKEISEMLISAQETERSRIGGELHDNVNQILSSAKLYVDVLQVSNDKQNTVKGKSLKYLQSAIDEIRKLSKELVAPQIRRKGIVEEINEIIENIHETSSIMINFEHEFKSGLLSNSLQITLFRIVQEQVKNILTHSKASKADIIIRDSGTAVQLIVRDNGVGFDVRRTSKGIGLSNIVERAKFYNGTATFNSSPGDGCEMIVVIPHGG